MTVDHLLDALCPAEVPETGKAALHSHVSRLRGTLGAGADRLATPEGSYRLVLDPGGLDLARARSLVAGSVLARRWQRGDARRRRRDSAGAQARCDPRRRRMSPDPFPPLPPAPPHPAGRTCPHLCTPDCTADPDETGPGRPEDGC